jgi:hypothetical protein
MRKDKIALVACFCFIAALAVFSVWQYAGAKGLESKVNDLQTKTGNLEAQNAELSTKVQNLTWMLGNLTSGEGFTFTKTDQFNVASLTFGGTSNTAGNYINMTIQNTGTSSWTLDATGMVNGVTGYVISAWTGCSLTVGAGGSIIIKIANVGWISGYQYSIELSTTSSTEITYVANAP